ncbi:MAG: hypothetical protein LBB91_00200 [Clostridiales bacterium]|jgi:thioredoxin-related protein|nr:hypothetical protein [Clostridiales bacterium]
MKSKHFFIIILLVFSLFFAACSSTDKPPTNAAGEPVDLGNLRDFLQPVSPTLIKNTRAIPQSAAKFDSITKANKKELRDNDILIAVVNQWPITFGELTFRTAQEEIMTGSAPDYEQMFNVLIEEKLNLSMADENDILPSQTDLVLYMAERKQDLMSEPEFLDVLDQLIAMTGISEDDYWKIFESYDVYRSLTREALYEFITDQRSDSTISADSYFDQCLAEFKQQSDIVYITKIPDLQFEIF